METPVPQPTITPPDALPLQVSARTHAGVVTMTVTGELDMATTPDLRRCAQEVLSNGAHRLVIECGGLSFIDAAGLGTLVAIQNLAERQGIGVRLSDVSPMMHKLVAAARLEGHFTMTSGGR